MTRLERYKQRLLEAASKSDQTRNYNHFATWEHDAKKLGYHVTHHTDSFDPTRKTSSAHKVERNDRSDYGTTSLGMKLGPPAQRTRGHYWHDTNRGYLNFKYMPESVDITEDGAVMASGTGGFSGAANASGPVAGFDPIMGAGLKNRIKRKIKVGLNGGSGVSAVGNDRPMVPVGGSRIQS